MKIVFVDETGGFESDRLGICVGVVDDYAYKSLKEHIVKAVQKSGWNPSIEFKGKHLFSSSTGDTSISIEKRLVIAEAVLTANVSKKNSRMKFVFGDVALANFKSDYVKLLPTLIQKVLGKTKDPILIILDEHPAIDKQQRRDLHSHLSAMGYCLVEDIVSAKSSNLTPGLLIVDVVAYLEARKKYTDAELMQKLTPEQHSTDTRVRKFLTSSRLLSIIKNLKVFNWNPK